MKSLEAIVIPTGVLEVNKKRVERAIQDYRNYEIKPYFLVSGQIIRDNKGRPKKDSQQYLIYRRLRDYGLRPIDLIIEGKSKDSLENFLYSIKRLNQNEINSIKISTNRTHYWRFKLFEKKAKKEGIIKENFKVEPIYTKESKREFVYGLLAFVKDYFRIKSSASLENVRPQRNLGNFLKEVLNGE